MSSPSPASPHPLSPYAAWLATAVALFVYVWQALPTTYLLDSSEFVATTIGLGASHPPGHPSYHLPTRLALLLPVGSLGLRIHLMSGIASAASAGLLIASAARWGWLRATHHVVGALVVAVLFTTAPGVLFQSIRAEVYALQMLVVATLVWLLARPEGAPSLRESAVAGVVLGVGLLNHHYLVVLFVPALVTGLAVMHRRDVGSLAGRLTAAVVAACLTMPGYAYLVAVGARDAQSTWGWPGSWSDVWWFLSAAPFQASFVEPTAVPLTERLAGLTALLMAQIGPTAFLLGAVGMGLLATRHLAPALLMGLAIALNISSVAGREPELDNPDIAGYLMASIWMMALAAIYGSTVVSDQLAQRMTRRAREVAMALVVLLVAAGALGRDTLPVRGGAYWQSDAMRRGFEHGAETDSWFVSTYFETLFNVWYGREVYDARPDLALIPRALLTHAPYRGRVYERLHAADALDRTATSPMALAEPGDRALYVEVERIVPMHELRCGSVDGFVLRTEPGCETPPLDNAACVESFNDAVAQLPRPLERQSARNVMWAGWNLANAMCATGRPQCCSALVESVLPLSPGDPDLIRLLDEARRALSGPASEASKPE